MLESLRIFLDKTPKNRLPKPEIIIFDEMDAVGVADNAKDIIPNHIYLPDFGLEPIDMEDTFLNTKGAIVLIYRFEKL